MNWETVAVAVTPEIHEVTNYSVTDLSATWPKGSSRSRSTLVHVDAVVTRPHPLPWVGEKRRVRLPGSAVASRAGLPEVLVMQVDIVAEGAQPGEAYVSLSCVVYT